MKIEIEPSKNVDYLGEKLGEYIWNLEGVITTLLDFVILLENVLRKLLDIG